MVVYLQGKFMCRKFTKKIIQHLNIPPQTHQVRNMKLKANPFENIWYIVDRIHLLFFDGWSGLWLVKDGQGEVTSNLNLKKNLVFQKISLLFVIYLSGHNTISYPQVFRPYFVPTKVKIFKHATVEIIDTKVHIQEEGVKRFAMFHIFVISVGYLVHKW